MLLLHRAVERPSWRQYALYAGAVLLLGLTHPIALLILLAHGVAAGLAGRATLLRWSAACATAAVPLAPLLYGAALQRGQVQWIPPVSLAGGPAVFAGVFGRAAVAAVLVVLALQARADARAAALILGWAVLPVVALWAVSLHSPLLLPRYLLFVVPAWALLAGMAVARVSGPRALAILLAFAVVGAPDQVGIRAVDGHGQDTKGAAAIITRQAAPGDAIAYSLSDPKGSWVARDLVARYVPADRRPDDVFQTRPQRVNGRLAADECADPATCLGRPPRIWVVRNGHRPDPLAGMTPAAKERLLRERYRLETVSHPTGVTVALLVAVT